MQLCPNLYFIPSRFLHRWVWLHRKKVHHRRSLNTRRHSLKQTVHQCGAFVSSSPVTSTSTNSGLKAQAHWTPFRMVNRQSHSSLCKSTYFTSYDRLLFRKGSLELFCRLTIHCSAENALIARHIGYIFRNFYHKRIFWKKSQSLNFSKKCGKKI